jgi:hypothetical protein
MALDFPDSSQYQTYVAPNGVTYIWNGTSWVVTPVLSVSKGGTGFTSYDQGVILYGNSSGTLSKLNPSTSGYVLSTNGTGADPSWIPVATGQTISTPSSAKLFSFYPGTATSLTGSTGIEYTNSSSLLMTVTAQQASQQSLKVSGTPTSVPIFSVDGSDSSQFLVLNSIAGQNGIVVGINPSAASATWAFLVNNSSQDTRFQVDTKDNLVQLKKGTQLQLFEGTGNFYSGFKATSATANTTYTLPPTTPSTGTSVLQSTPDGVMTWVPMSVSGGAGTVSTASINEIAGYYAGAGSSVKGSSTFTNDITNGVVAIGHTTNSTGINSGALTITGGVGIGGSLFVGGTSVSLFQSVANNYLYLNTGANVLRIQTDAANSRVRMFENMTTGTLGFFGTSGGTLYLGTDSGTANGNITIRGNNTTGGGGNQRAAIFTLATATSNGSGSGGTMVFQTSTSGNATANLSNALRTRLRIEGAATGTSLNESIIILGDTNSGTAWTSYLRGVDAIGTNVSSGEIQIQAGRSTGTGNAQGISFYVSSAGVASTTDINTANQIARFSSTGLTINSTTTSTTTSSGALIVSGGVGIGGSLNVANVSKFSNHLEIKTGNELRLWRTADTNYTGLKSAAVSDNITFTLPLNTGSNGQFLTTDGNGVLSFTTDPVQVSSGTANHIAYYASAGNTVSGSSTFTNDITGGVVSITHNTTSTSSITGALVISGGLGVAGNIYTGGLLNLGAGLSANGAVSFTNTSQAATFTNRIIKSGSFQMALNAGIGTEGAVISVRRANVRDTASSGSYSFVAANAFKKISFSTTSTGQTYGIAANVYIEDAPDSSTTGAVGTPANTVTITNSYALYVENGKTYMGGALDAPGSYRCSIGLATDQTIAASGDTTPNFTTISDPNSWWNATTKKLTPNVAGWYYVSYQANWDAASKTNDQCNIQMRKNGTTFSIGQMQLLSGNPYSMSCSGIVNVNGSSDYLDFTVYTANTTSQVLNGEASQQYTRVDMFKIQ